MEKADIKSMNLHELSLFVEELGEKAFAQSRFISGFIKSTFLLLMK